MFYSVAKPISKVTVRCPHCGAEQLEPELAKSTFCRRCSQYFAVTPATMAGNAGAGAPKTVEKPKPGFFPVPTVRTSSVEPRLEAASGGIKQRLGEIMGTRPKQRVAQCFECNSAHEVSSSASSSTCKACGAYIDLQDYKINGSFSRNIKTRGVVYLGSKGDLSSSKIICSEATLHGKMRGNLQCDGPVTIRVQGKLFGTIEAGPVVVEKGSDVQFSRPLKTTSLEVHGRMVGHVVSETHILVTKYGALEGDVTATGFTVEKGGIYQGELTITPRQVVTGTATTEPSGAGQTLIQDTGPVFLSGDGAPAHG